MNFCLDQANIADVGNGVEAYVTFEPKFEISLKSNLFSEILSIFIELKRLYEQT